MTRNLDKYSYTVVELTVAEELPVPAHLRFILHDKAYGIHYDFSLTFLFGLRIGHSLYVLILTIIEKFFVAVERQPLSVGGTRTPGDIFRLLKFKFSFSLSSLFDSWIHSLMINILRGTPEIYGCLLA